MSFSPHTFSLWFKLKTSVSIISGFGLCLGILAFWRFWHFWHFGIFSSKEGIIADQSCLSSFAIPWLVLLNVMIPKCQKCQKKDQKKKKKKKGQNAKGPPKKAAKPECQKKNKKAKSWLWCCFFELIMQTW